MSNATKYAYPGTKIIISFRDTGDALRPHQLSITDFGPGIDAEYPSQVFQLYYRGSNSSQQTMGSGIGLYVSRKIAELLGAKLDWNCRKLSEYNIPMMCRYLELTPTEQLFSSINVTQIKQEYQRLLDDQILKSVFNDEYLTQDKDWSPREICGELENPTYSVTFTLDL